MKGNAKNCLILNLLLIHNSYGSDVVDLLDRLLKLDPSKRPTATEALQHEYLFREPLPFAPSEIPKFISSHEYDKHKSRSRRQPKAPNVDEVAREGQDIGLHQRYY